MVLFLLTFHAFSDLLSIVVILEIAKSILLSSMFTNMDTPLASWSSFIPDMAAHCFIISGFSLIWVKAFVSFASYQCWPEFWKDRHLNCSYQTKNRWRPVDL